MKEASATPCSLWYSIEDDAETSASADYANVFRHRERRSPGNCSSRHRNGVSGIGRGNCCGDGRLRQARGINGRSSGLSGKNDKQANKKQSRDAPRRCSRSIKCPSRQGKIVCSHWCIKTNSNGCAIANALVKRCSKADHGAVTAGITPVAGIFFRVVHLNARHFP